MVALITIEREFGAVQPSASRNRRLALCSPPGSRRAGHLLFPVRIECELECDEVVPQRAATSQLPAQATEYRGLRAVTLGSGVIPPGYCIPLVGDEIARAERLLGGHGDI